jgi:hypothetical protein
MNGAVLSAAPFAFCIEAQVLAQRRRKENRAFI